MGAGLLLLAAVGGYWVLERATSQTGLFRLLSMIVGLIIIVFGITGASCHVMSRISCSTISSSSGIAAKNCSTTGIKSCCGKADKKQCSFSAKKAREAAAAADAVE